MMNHLEHNRRSWNSGVMSTSVWAQPVDEATIAAARAGRWDVLLTPKTPVPRSWLSDIEGKDVLCLASGGGQQVPILSAAGALVVSFDLSEEQLRKDQFVAEREGLTIRCVRGDMANLDCFGPASFDLIFHPASNVFAENLEPIWRECYRVLRPGGALLCGFMNPTVFMFDHDEVEATGELTIRYSLPYSDEGSLSAIKLRAKMEANEPLEFSHSLASQIGGQTDAGFVIAGLYEDHWYDDTWPFSNRAPVCIATRALRAL
jgi:SAM-dependent methyltransferase